MIVEIAGFVGIGVAIGLLARLVVPGRPPSGLVLTVLLGIVGAVVGGLAAAAFALDPPPTLLISAAAAALLVVLITGGSPRRTTRY